MVGNFPSELETWPRTWRTREDPFADVWDEVRELLEPSPGLQAKTLFAWLQRQYPGRFEEGQLRTLQRHFVNGGRRPDRPRRCSSQAHHPGRLAASDFTAHVELGRDDRRPALRPYGLSLRAHLLELGDRLDLFFGELREPKRGACSKRRFWELGGVPERHRSDRMTAAVNNLLGTKGVHRDAIKR